LHQYDIDKLKNIIYVEKVNGIKSDARASDDCLLEVTVVLKEFFDFIYTEKAETVANGLISLDSWISNRQSGLFKTRELAIGQVYMADLGLGYDFESGYYHPVIILEIIGSTVMVLPVTSSKNQVNNVGKSRYIKLIKKTDFENQSLSLAVDSVAIMSNLRAMGPNRLLSFIGKINADKTKEIKEATASIVFSTIVNDYKYKTSELEKKVEALEKKASESEEKILKLVKQVEALECKVDK